MSSYEKIRATERLMNVEINGVHLHWPHYSSRSRFTSLRLGSIQLYDAFRCITSSIFYVATQDMSVLMIKVSSVKVKDVGH